MEDLVADCKSDFEKVQTVTDWVTNLWAHDGDNVPEQFDPIYILQNVTENGAQYRCVEYGSVIAGCPNALGISTRTIGLKTQDVETREYGAGHVAAEAYLKDYGKWVFIDVQWGMIPMMQDTLLNAVQLSQVIENSENYEEPVHFLSFQDNSIDGQEYVTWIREYLYYYDVTAYTNSEDGYTGKSIMLAPNDAKEPTIFQIYYPLEMDIFTHSLPDFYPAVK